MKCVGMCAFFISVEIKTLTDQILDPDNEHNAFLKIKRGHRDSSKINRFQWDYATNLQHYIDKQEKRLIDFSDFHHFIIFEPKERSIDAPSMEMRHAEVAIINVVEPIFDFTMIDHSYACRKGKGPLQACYDIQEILRNLPDDEYWFVGHIDIRQYYKTINHSYCLGLFNSVMREEWLYQIWNDVLEGFYPGSPIGAPASQLNGNINMNPLDHYVVDKCNEPNYGRYTDDIFIIGTDRDYIEDMIEKIALFVNQQNKQDVHRDKTKILCIHRPNEDPIAFDFCGYRILPDKLFIRKRTILNFARRIKTYVKDYKEGRGDIETIKKQIVSLNALTCHAYADSIFRLKYREVFKEAIELCGMKDKFVIGGRLDKAQKMKSVIS